MPSLRFTYDGKLTLKNFILKDATGDSRLSLLKPQDFIIPKFQIHENIYMIINDTAFNLAKFFDSQAKNYSAIMANYDNNLLIVIPSGNEVFWNDNPIQPNNYISCSPDSELTAFLLNKK